MDDDIPTLLGSLLNPALGVLDVSALVGSLGLAVHGAMNLNIKILK